MSQFPLATLLPHPTPTVVIAIPAAAGRNLPVMAELRTYRADTPTREKAVESSSNLDPVPVVADPLSSFRVAEGVAHMALAAILLLERLTEDPSTFKLLEPLAVDHLVGYLFPRGAAPVLAAVAMF
jgi:hypothetical protein